MPLDVRDAAYVWDMLNAARQISSFTADADEVAYLDNEVLKAAIERKMEIIGEAARKLSDKAKGECPEVPWRRLVAQRNVLAHEYGKIDHRRIWRVVTENLPALITSLERILPPHTDER